MKNDMTTGSEWRHLLHFALPIMLGNILQQLYNTVDGIVVGRCVSDAALSAVGSCGSLAAVFIALAMGMSTGCGIVTAQLFGAKRHGEMRRSASTTLILLCSVGAVLAVFGFFGAKTLLGGFLGIDDPVILSHASLYFRIYCAGLIFQFAYNAVAAILRAVGDSRATLYFLCVSAVVNIVLDILFVVVFPWGVAGVAVATVISQIICTFVSFWYMFRKYPDFRFSKISEFVFDTGKLRLCLKMAIPTTLQQFTVSCGYLFLQKLVNSFGPVTMAAYTVGGRYEQYMGIPVSAFFMAMSNFTGQNIGAGKTERVKRALLSAEIMAVSIVAVMVAIVYIFARPLSALFGVEGEILEQSVEYLRFTAPFFFIFAIYLPFNGTLQGSGDAFFTMCCALTVLGSRVIAAYLMAYVFDFGYASCWQSIIFGWGIGLIMASARFATGRWKTKALVSKH